jgi:hypothetical protein
MLAMTGTGRRPWLVPAMLAGVLMVAGCSSTSRSAPPTHPTSSTTIHVTSSVAPTCRYAWLRVSLRRDNAYAHNRSTAQDTLTVKTTHTCTLKGWPSLRHVPSSQQSASARPGFTPLRRGRPVAVLLTPTKPAFSTLTVWVPPAWRWGGGNLCAGFTSAMVALPQVRQRYFEMSVPSPIVSCGGPSDKRFRVTVTPLAGSLESGGSASTTANVSSRATGGVVG